MPELLRTENGGIHPQWPGHDCAAQNRDNQPRDETGVACPVLTMDTRPNCK